MFEVGFLTEIYSSLSSILRGCDQRMFLPIFAESKADTFLFISNFEILIENRKQSRDEPDVKRKVKMFLGGRCGVGAALRVILRDSIDKLY